MSDNAGCAWLFGIAVAGFVTLMIAASLTNAASRAAEDERFRVCVESGGAWDGFWKSCSPAKAEHT